MNKKKMFTVIIAVAIVSVALVFNLKTTDAKINIENNANTLDETSATDYYEGRLNDMP